MNMGKVNGMVDRWWIYEWEDRKRDICNRGCTQIPFSGLRHLFLQLQAILLALGPQLFAQDYDPFLEATAPTDWLTWRYVGLALLTQLRTILKVWLQMHHTSTSPYQLSSHNSTDVSSQDLSPINVLATNFHLRICFLENQPMKVWYQKYPHSSTGITCSSHRKWGEKKELRLKSPTLLIPEQLLTVEMLANHRLSLFHSLCLFLFLSPHSLFIWIQLFSLVEFS